MHKVVSTPTLDIAYEESGPPGGIPVVLLHGFPDDVRAWDAVVPLLTAAGCRTLVPYLRGYGPTRFRDPATPRSGEQAALGADLLELLDGLAIDRAVLAGYDWGGRAACIVSALWPERARGLVSIAGGGYNIQNIARAARPAAPDKEHRYWYQWYFQTERGRAGLAANRRELTRLLWKLWSPNLHADDATFARTAASFDNPDFVEVIIHSYRHRHAAAPGDPALAEIEARLAAQPTIAVPTIVLHGESDAVDLPDGSAGAAEHFTGGFERRLVPVAGHLFPREAPAAVVEAVLGLAREPAGILRP